MNSDKRNEEDYRKIWREFFCAAINTMSVGHGGMEAPLTYQDENVKHVKYAAKAADVALEEYLKRKSKLREYNLAVFK